MDHLRTFQQAIQLGKISTICDDKDKDENDNPIYAKVLPLNADGVVTLPLVIEPWLRGEFGDLEVDTEVWYIIPESGEGSILARADGNWTGEIPGSLKLVKGKDGRDDLELERGDLTLDEGDELMKKGDLTMNEGDFTMDKGDATMKDGDLTLLNGSITVQDGNITLNGNLIIKGDIQLDGSMTATGNIAATGNISSSGSISATGSMSSASVSATGDVSSGSSSVNTLNTELSTFKGEYAAHTHTTPAGQSGPPEG